VFVDPTTTPGWLQTFIRINPVSHLVSAARDLMLGTPAGGDVLWTLVATAAIVIVFAPLTARLYAAQT
jgi:ABC-2 type transport system permease protein